ncbi:unnamed protein product, partial [Hapterophycus canaliculatus]
LLIFSFFLVVCFVIVGTHERSAAPTLSTSSPRLSVCRQGVMSDDVVLDIGCGDGRVLVTMAKILGCRGIGIDISEVQ